MFTVRRGTTVDYPFIKKFIEQSEAVFDQSSLFTLVENEKEEILGVIGVVRCGEVGFLRSFVFSPAFPIDRLPLFFERVLIEVKEMDCRSLCLSSNKRWMISFFELFGFEEIEFDHIPEEFKLSTVFSTINAKSNVFYMWKTM